MEFAGPQLSHPERPDTLPCILEVYDLTETAAGLSSPPAGLNKGESALTFCTKISQKNATAPTCQASTAVPERVRSQESMAASGVEFQASAPPVGVHGHNEEVQLERTTPGQRRRQRFLRRPQKLGVVRETLCFVLSEATFLNSKMDANLAHMGSPEELEMPDRTLGAQRVLRILFRGGVEPHSWTQGGRAEHSSDLYIGFSLV